MELSWPTALALGPGLGQAKQMPNVVEHVLRGFGGPLVLDADGLNSGATLGRGLWESRRGHPTIVTPHPGEMARLRKGARLAELTGDDDDARLRTATEYAELTGVVVVLKGHRTVVVDAAQRGGARAYVNTTGNPGMATGGMGDVLTGLIAALLAQGAEAFDAACLGAHVHGLAADHCARGVAPVGYLAREVADEIPAALHEINRPRIGFH